MHAQDSLHYASNYLAKCPSCGYETTDPLEFRCKCGSPLEIAPDIPFDPSLIGEDRYDMWRYKAFFPYVKGEVSLGEGWTPLIRLRNSILLKLEFLNPTGSFKDRGSSMLLSTISDPVREKKGYISEDSSGNAGASIAAYSARANIKAKIYVPEKASGPKLDQIVAYGAELIRVRGNRNEITAEAMKTEEGERKFYVGHIYHPAFRDGIRTLAYEIAEQLRWNVPDYIFLPTSAGTLLLGVISGFKHMLSSGVIDVMPRIIASQTEVVSPVYHKLKGLKYEPPVEIKSIADALISTNPPLLDTMVNELKRANGDAEIVEEGEIFSAYKELASSGFYVEPSSAVAYAAYKKQLGEGKIEKNSSVVIVLTGSGLKSRMQS